MQTQTGHVVHVSDDEGVPLFLGIKSNGTFVDVRAIPDGCVCLIWDGVLHHVAKVTRSLEKVTQ